MLDAVEWHSHYNKTLNDIINGYDQILALLKPILWLEQSDNISNIQRGLYIKWKPPIFWDYLDGNHCSVQRLMWIESCLFCYKITLHSWKDIIFTSNLKSDEYGWNIKSLDEYRSKLTPQNQHKFDEICRKMCMIEINYNLIQWKKKFETLMPLFKRQLLEELNKSN